MITKEQVSAGGVVFRRRGVLEVALIRVGEGRWQLPKGLVGRRETPEEAARREVREETGLVADLLAPIDTVEYWYVSKSRGERVRFHKRVHFFLCHYRSGEVSDHDHLAHDREVDEARWFGFGEAAARLAFANERQVLARAGEMIEALSDVG